VSQSITQHSNAGNRQRGITLIEILIALALGTVLIGGMINVLVGYKKTSAISEAMVEMQQSARFALEEIARDLRMAGFQGCVDLETGSANMLADDRPTNNLATTSITGSVISAGNQLQPAGPLNFAFPGAPIVPVANSHLLTVQFGSPETHTIIPMATIRAPVVLENNTAGFSKDDLVLISNCQVADVFQVSSALENTLNHDGEVNSGDSELSAQYGSGGEANLPRVMRFESNVYYVANTGRQNGAGDAVMALYKQSLPFSGPPIEIVEGVEVFLLRFGIRGENDTSITFVGPESIAGLEERITSVQIGLLMQSIDRVYDDNDNRIYQLAGQSINPGAGPLTHAQDRRMRLAFNASVKVRNRR